MNFEIITLFPNMFQSPFEEGVVGQALKHHNISLSFVNPRDFAKESIHKNVDDRPFGGGDGMVMMAPPLLLALKEAEKRHVGKEIRRIYLSPQGRLFNDSVAKELSEYESLIFICGRYGGIDERILRYVDDEISAGDFILSGGELAAMTMVDAISRFIPGVLGHPNSAHEDSFAGYLLEAPQFTRPREFENTPVPQVLLEGDHKAIEEWRKKISLAKTRQRRPDLAAKIEDVQWSEVDEFLDRMSPEEKLICGIADSAASESSMFLEDVGL